MGGQLNRHSVGQFFRRGRQCLHPSPVCTLAEAGAVIAFLKEKTVTRPTLFVQADCTLHALFGATFGARFVWEPFPWLGFTGGLELWYTDTFRLAIPAAITLRFRLD